MTCALMIVPLLAASTPLKLLGPPETISVRAVSEFDQSHIQLLNDATSQWVRVDHAHQMLLVTTGQTPVPPGMRLHLQSGESIPGSIEAAEHPEQVAWRHPWMGRLVVPLDDVVGVSRLSPTLESTAAVDVLELINGDRLEGFCDSIGPEIVMELDVGDGDHEMVGVPWKRVRSLRLAGAEFGPPTGCSAFVDGTIVRLEALRRTPDGVLKHAPHHRAVSPGLGAPAQGWVMLPMGGAVLPLGEARVTPVDDRTLERSVGAAALVDSGPVRLPGDGAWWIDIPDGMSRLRARVHVPVHLQHLAGGAVHVDVDGREQALIQLDALIGGSERGVIDIDVSAVDRVRIRRTTGQLGEVGATFELVDGVLLGSVP